MSKIKSKIKPTLRQVCDSGLAVGLAAAVVIVSLVSLPGAAQAQTGRVRATPTTPLTRPGMTFQRAMSLGYSASRQGDFNTALINFQRALMIRPGNPYASAAADNMAYYIQHERVLERQQAIDELQSQLTTATTQKDWVCAATTLDQLTTYTEPNSLNRERLVGQRGEVSGLLDARLDQERWSTVCAAQQPVY
jgi:tetratricopeptide (TPR) repeat protein